MHHPSNFWTSSVFRFSLPKGLHLLSIILITFLATKKFDSKNSPSCYFLNELQSFSETEMPNCPRPHSKSNLVQQSFTLSSLTFPKSEEGQGTNWQLALFKATKRCISSTSCRLIPARYIYISVLRGLILRPDVCLSLWSKANSFIQESISPLENIIKSSASFPLEHWERYFNLPWRAELLNSSGNLHQHNKKCNKGSTCLSPFSPLKKPSRPPSNVRRYRGTLCSLA